ncbi:hypothetical protein [Legionella longbeachae]|uniref:Uncharacterized protein n=1 Tax=Legionella longbeachae serogroup 1 (strain NSW150) TaxID=661367 RepID=D3HSM1_LEGLN|nr:hypothetical protein [Legionella longbeachae]VEE02404.1 Uncharacterised protein [Legionella oakridgensis]HBD7398105.1 hypothetical protein [Legionella pneumophila]ARB91315.1 hypothetical protein A6J40_03530 [Legionella longbeachae]ARM32261.1 hypothetical protein B0B39_01350 [Legionella longbeachae]EEZ94955.1 hypothetical protein LLB_0107 [Legionella longbeachae D-4968]
MKREQIIESLINQFTENLNNLPDETLQNVESGKLVISLTPDVGNESGGNGLALAKRAAVPESTKAMASKERLIKI